MNKKGVIIWIASLVVFALSLIPFIFFMFNITVDNLVAPIIFIATGAVLYVVGSKQITHKNGYNYFQAKKFYDLCCEKGFKNTKEMKRNADEIKKLAALNDFSKNLDLNALCEMYSYGKDFSTKKK